MKKARVIRFTPQDKRCIATAISYIDRHYATKMSPEQLCLEVNLSKQKLQSGIRLVTGFTLHKYICKVRIDKAKIILDGSNDSIKTIAFVLGYKHPTNFIAAFKASTDFTPSQYRIRDAV